jgi:ADP-heptose:LPS heptosyltransferase
MGDVILVEPVIRALRTRYSNAEITLFTSKERSCSAIVQYFDSKPDITIGMNGEGELTKDFLYTQKGYDIRIDLDLAYESRKNINYIDAYFQVAGFKDEVQEIDGLLKVANSIPDADRVPILKYDEPRIINEKYVSVDFTGSGWPGKEWDLKKWMTIINKISDKGFKIAFTSKIQKDGVLIADKPGIIMNIENDFNLMMNYLRYSEFHIGADNGPMHIASSFGTNCFIIAGAAIPAYTTKNSGVFQCVKSLPCLHCKGRQFYNQLENGQITFVSRCDNPDQYACMKKLETEQVLDDFDKFYKSIYPTCQEIPVCQEIPT